MKKDKNINGFEIFQNQNGEYVVYDIYDYTTYCRFISKRKAIDYIKEILWLHDRKEEVEEKESCDENGMPYTEKNPCLIEKIN